MYRPTPQIPSEPEVSSSSSISPTIGRSYASVTRSGRSSTNAISSRRNSADTTVEDPALFWQEDPVEDNMDPNSGNAGGASGGPPDPEEAPPPYPGNGQANAQGIMQMMAGLLEVQHTLSNDIRNMAHAQNELGNGIRHLAQIAEMNQNMYHGGRHLPRVEDKTFKPSMFRTLDMTQITKDHKLLSEEFVNWKISIYRVLRANPSAADLPIERLVALILAGIGEKAERRLTCLGQNPNFNSLEEFFDKLKTIFCSSTVQTDAEEQFNKARQKPDEDINSWHARCQLYYRLAFPTQDYWNLLLKKFFQGLSNRKLAQKTCQHIVHRPGGWEALCNQEGYEVCLSLTIRDEAFYHFMNSFLGDKTSSFKNYEKTETSVPMDTSSVQNRHYFGKGQRSSRTNFNPHYNEQN